ncbi:hypothetical protein NPIL_356251 [Nephila pilipes]|uniref:Uncharacterized protein n=1 Tax=Nephila pilipes TaxID=299642 RepID=A0A8X6QLC3_NEPPI|nr:hypothetical protein NPIL_356251 [Nephila pilipes]
MKLVHVSIVYRLAPEEFLAISSTRSNYIENVAERTQLKICPIIYESTDISSCDSSTFLISHLGQMRKVDTDPWDAEMDGVWTFHWGGHAESAHTLIMECKTEVRKVNLCTDSVWKVANEANTTELTKMGEVVL